MGVDATMMVVFFLILTVLCSLAQQTYIFNTRSCQQMFDRNFEIHELSCKYVGVRSYKIIAPTTVKVVEIDRLMDASLELPSDTSIERVNIKEGIVCPYVIAPVHVMIYLGDVLCVSFPFVLICFIKVKNTFKTSCLP